MGPLAVVIPLIPQPDGQATWLALSILVGLILFSAGFHRVCGEILQELSLIEDAAFADLPYFGREEPPGRLDPDQRTAVLLVTGLNALGLRSLVALGRSLPDGFPQVFILALAPDAACGAGKLRGYEAAARALGMNPGYGSVSGANPVLEAERACLRIAESFRATVFFAGKPDLKPPRWHHRFLPSAAGEAVLSRLHRRCFPALVLPIAVEMKRAATRVAALP